MSYRQITQHCYGDTDGRVSRADMAPFLRAAGDAAAAVAGALATPQYNCLSIARRDDDLRSLEALASDWRLRYRDILVVGIGGSSLGARSLVEPLGGPVPRIHFIDNVDVFGLEALLHRLELARTALIVVSKSGNTVEAMAQALVAVRALAGAIGPTNLADHVVAIAAPGDSPLRRLAAHWGAVVLDHDPDVAGRYSVLTLVGLLPALLAGIDARAVRGGARHVLDQFVQHPTDAAPVEGAAWQVALDRRAKVATAVLMPYDQRMTMLAQWYRQLWGESLGKAGVGLTPYAALGPVDQHSQLQHWLEGAGDKSFTVIVPDLVNQGTAIPLQGLEAQVPELAYLHQRTLGDLVSAMARATIETLAGRGRPVRVLALPRLDAAAFGALFMHFMLETITAGHLLGIDPFTQPAVDAGKQLARDYLRAGTVGLAT